MVPNVYLTSSLHMINLAKEVTEAVFIPLAKYSYVTRYIRRLIPVHLCVKETKHTLILNTHLY